MRKLIGTVAIVLFLYVGLVGSERFNIEPFILEWLQGVKKELTHKVSEEVENVKEEALNAVSDSVTE